MQRKPLYLATAFAIASGQAFADAETAIEDMTIIGNPDAVKEQAGSAHVLTAKDLEKFEYTDIAKILRQVPGINIREEEGYGLRPNIGIRGTGSERSGRITLMEDGILIAPAPYAAPSAYYFPTTGRLAGVEVLKGPAAIKNGPYTIGGAVNLLSTPIPDQDGGKIKFEMGTDATYRLHANYGQNGDNFDWVVETHQWQSEGFGSIAQSDSDTGFDKSDYLAKFRVHSDTSADVYQQLELKIQKSDEASEQSYLGLTDADFNSNPTRRYAPSQLDEMNSGNDLVSLNYFVDFNDVFTLSATAYKNEVARNWFKTDKVDGKKYNGMILDLNNGVGGVNDQAILDGTFAGAVDVNIKDNNRAYTSQGIDVKLGFNFETGNAAHELSAGIRYHEDEEDRLQRNSTYNLENGGLTLSEAEEWGTAGNRIVAAEAISLYIHDQITFGDLTLTPGVRYESIDFSRRDWNDTARTSLKGSERKNETRDVLPGIGATYQLNSELQLIAGIHKGFTPAGYTDSADNEESTNFEAGFRFSNDKVAAELIAFFNDYENMLGTCTASAGCNVGDIGDQYNGGEAAVKGLEALFSYSLVSGSNFDVPVQLTYTYTDATFETTFDSDFFGDVESGDQLTYTPENQAMVSIGYVATAGWDLYLTANYTDEMVTTHDTDFAGYDKTDSSLIFGLAGHYQFNEDTRFYAMVDNLTDEADIVARAPYGARTNKPRGVTFGVNYSF